MIYQRDCLDGLRELPDHCIDLVVTDPPYLVNYKTGHRKDKTHRFCSVIENDNNEQLIRDVIIELHRVLKYNTAFYCFCSQDTVDLFRSIIKEYFTVKNTIVWVKNNWTAGDLKAQYGKQYELIIYANKGRRYINGRRDQDVWFFDRVSGTKQMHQNQKPVELIEKILEKSSSSGDLVLDPFMGSGTTAEACIRLNRKYLGYEIDTGYYEVAMSRLKEYTKCTT